MTDKSEQLTRESSEIQSNSLDSDKSVAEGYAQPPVIEETQKLHPVKAIEFLPEVETPLPGPLVGYTKKAPDQKRSPAKFFKRQDSASMRMLQDHCRQLCLSLFFRDEYPVRSLGFTSSIEGEGKSFLALITARILAHDSTNPVVLVDCNWEHSSLSESFDIPTTPGLAEWLRGDCDEEDIRYQVDHNLTVIPAGNGSQDAVKLLKQAQLQGLLKLFRRTDELFIVDLPPILTTGYGTLAAGLLESIVVVARAQAVPDSMVAETCKQLKDLPIHGIILNQGASRVPHWIRQLL
jgi:Mrp family chromosome partitioning ATPase